MTTAGDLVFQGRADGQLYAYSAITGRALWNVDGQAGIVAAPISYSFAGNQYIAVMAGYSGTGSTLGNLSSRYGWQAQTQKRRLLVFSLFGTVTLPQQEKTDSLRPLEDPTYSQNLEKEHLGSSLYAEKCVWCHGGNAVAGGHAPDLRVSLTVTSEDAFDSVVRSGAMQDKGMPIFDEITSAQAEAIRQYLRRRASDLRDQRQNSCIQCQSGR
jgi:quinohemoprotein ethanol dehydrogenase